MYEVMRYWDDDQPEWDAEERDFAAAWRRQPKWVVSRSFKSVGPNATLVEDLAKPADFFPPNPSPQRPHAWMRVPLGCCVCGEDYERQNAPDEPAMHRDATPWCFFWKHVLASLGANRSPVQGRYD